jgi:hypothetical protein
METVDKRNAPDIKKKQDKKLFFEITREGIICESVPTKKREKNVL